MKPSLARTLVFVTSAAVLVVEILAARLLAPYLGVSLEVFTGIIGVILAGISIGAWLGGRMADRLKPDRLVGPLLLAGGLTAIAAPLITDAVGPSLDRSAVSIVLVSALAFFAPAAFLSAVPPVVVKLQLASLDQTGTVVGTYSAIGTAGAIFGTFVTGFVLIAAFPTRPIVAALGIGLSLIGAVMSINRGRWSLLSVLTAALLALTMLNVDPPCQFETTYHCAVVRIDEERPTGRTLLLDRLPNSYVDVEDPTYLRFRYIKLIADILEVTTPTGPISVVSIGGGGFTMPGYVEATRPGSVNTVLEIDNGLVDIASNELVLADNLDVVIDDARISLRDLPNNSADIVIGDAYSGSSVPWHLTTIEYNNQIAKVLNSGGIYVMNVIDYDELRFVRAEAASLKEVFANVALFAPTSYLAGERGGNFILVSSDQPFDIESIERAIRARGGSEFGISEDRLDRFIDGAPVLTDDFAPVDQILGRP